MLDCTLCFCVANTFIKTTHSEKLFNSFIIFEQIVCNTSPYLIDRIVSRHNFIEKILSFDGNHKSGNEICLEIHTQQHNITHFMLMRSNKEINI